MTNIFRIFVCCFLVSIGLGILVAVFSSKNPYDRSNVAEVPSSRTGTNFWTSNAVAKPVRFIGSNNPPYPAWIQTWPSTNIMAGETTMVTIVYFTNLTDEQKRNLFELLYPPQPHIPHQ